MLLSITGMEARGYDLVVLHYQSTYQGIGVHPTLALLAYQHGFL
jgi:hypothetical protein